MIMKRPFQSHKGKRPHTGATSRTGTARTSTRTDALNCVLKWDAGHHLCQQDQQSTTGRSDVAGLE